MFSRTRSPGPLVGLAIGAILTGFLAVGGASSALAVDYSGGEVDNNTAGPGAAVGYSSRPTGLASGTDASIEVAGNLAAEQGKIVPAAVSTLRGTVKIDSRGVIAFGFTVPRDARPGDLYAINVFASDGVNTFSDEVSITIAGLPADGGRGTLSATGAADLTGYIWFAGGVLLLGVIAASTSFAARRRLPEEDDFEPSVDTVSV
jgi:hypothetical protein